MIIKGGSSVKWEYVDMTRSIPTPEYFNWAEKNGFSKFQINLGR
jgi:hypothetical protein